jgi:transcriptional regulator with XRE-family HTH domain
VREAAGKWFKDRVLFLLAGTKNKQMNLAHGLNKTEGHISKLIGEKAKPNPRLSTVEEIAAYFGMSISEFFGAPKKRVSDPDDLAGKLNQILASEFSPTYIDLLKLAIESTSEKVLTAEQEKRNAKYKTPIMPRKRKPDRDKEKAG